MVVKKIISGIFCFSRTHIRKIILQKSYPLLPKANNTALSFINNGTPLFILLKEYEVPFFSLLTDNILFLG